MGMVVTLVGNVSVRLLLPRRSLRFARHHREFHRRLRQVEGLRAGQLGILGVLPRRQRGDRIGVVGEPDELDVGAVLLEEARASIR